MTDASTQRRQRALDGRGVIAQLRQQRALVGRAGLRLRVEPTDVLQPLHTNTGDFQRDAADSARHVDAWTPLVVGRAVKAIALPIIGVSTAANVSTVEQGPVFAVTRPRFTHPKPVYGLAVWARQSSVKVRRVPAAISAVRAVEIDDQMGVRAICYTIFTGVSGRGRVRLV